MSFTPGKTFAVKFDEQRIDAIFARFDQCHLPGVAVGIAVRGKPVYRKGFGLASMELPVVLSPSVRMRICSTTKHFTCLTYMLLCEEGKADIDDPVGKFLPEIHPVAQKVTMRQLMGHTSGLRDAADIVYQFSGTGHLVSTAALLSLYRDIDDVNFAPGSSFCYINGGYLMLSVAIERITGRTLEDALRERIFEPVGMHDTLLRRFDRDFVPNSASMHMTSLTGGYEKSSLGTAIAGEGGIVSTVDDMLRWLAHMDAPRVGSAATWAVMKAPQTLLSGTSTGYGLGLMSDNYRGVEIIHHGGIGLGAHSQMLKVPAAALDITFMINRQDAFPEEIVSKILDVCLPDLEPARRPSRRVTATGVFRSLATGRVIQLRTAPSAIPPWIKEGQQLALIDGFEEPVELNDDGVLWPVGLLGSLKFGLTLVGDPISPTSIRFNDYGSLDDLGRVQTFDEPQIDSIVGRYRSETTGTNVSISDTQVGARMNTIGRFGSAEFRLEYLAEHIWRAKSTSPAPWGGTLLFDDDYAVFRFSSCLRTRDLPFRRCA